MVLHAGVRADVGRHAAGRQRPPAGALVDGGAGGRGSGLGGRGGGPPPRRRRRLAADLRRAGRADRGRRHQHPAGGLAEPADQLLRRCSRRARSRARRPPGWRPRGCRPPPSRRCRTRSSAAFPNVTAIPVRDVMERVAVVLDEIAVAVRLVALFTLGTGLVVMAGGAGRHPLPASLRVGSAAHAGRHPGRGGPGLRRRVRRCWAPPPASAGDCWRPSWPGRSCAGSSMRRGASTPLRSCSAWRPPSRLRSPSVF